MTSTKNTSFTFDLFANETSANGQGQYYLGSVGATTNMAGFAQFTFTAYSPPAGALDYSATATDPLNNTSEFSQTIGDGVAAPAPSGPIPTDVPLFTWQLLTGGVSEELAIVDQTTGQNPLLTVPNLSGNTYQLPAAQALTLGHSYTWYIGEVSSTGAIAWSGGTNFNVLTLATPTPIAPMGTVMTSTASTRRRSPGAAFPTPCNTPCI